MAEISLNEQLGQLVVRFPQIRQTLEQMGIDYCCGGCLTLHQAADKKGLSVENVVKDLREAIETGRDRQQYRDWSVESLTELADYIEKNHHSFMNEQLPRLEQLINKTLKAHNDRHGRMLKQLRETYTALKSEIELHLSKEEQILFPFIRQIDNFKPDQEIKPELHCGSVENPIGQMECEHDRAGKALERMREITSGYRLPDDACNTFKGLYDGLKELEKNLHEHIHLENNILFPRAVKLEKSIW
jgi:regulator of cell morphogenesis and NO signaling